MTPKQKTAIGHHCRLAGETTHPRFRSMVAPTASLVLTVNSGWERIEADFGGPVWHASIASPYLSFAALRQHAKSALHGVGDARLGEWAEEYQRNGMRFVHIKRRLRPEEEATIGPAVDLRGTPEYTERLAACPWLPAGYRE